MSLYMSIPQERRSEVFVDDILRKVSRQHGTRWRLFWGRFFCGLLFITTRECFWVSIIYASVVLLYKVLVIYLPVKLNSSRVGVRLLWFGPIWLMWMFIYCLGNMCNTIVEMTSHLPWPPSAIYWIELTHRWGKVLCLSRGRTCPYCRGARGWDTWRKHSHLLPPHLALSFHYCPWS